MGEGGISSRVSGGMEVKGGYLAEEACVKTTSYHGSALKKTLWGERRDAEKGTVRRTRERMRNMIY